MSPQHTHPTQFSVIGVSAGSCKRGPKFLDSGLSWTTKLTTGNDTKDQEDIKYMSKAGRI